MSVTDKVLFKCIRDVDVKKVIIESWIGDRQSLIYTRMASARDGRCWLVLCRDCDLLLQQLREVGSGQGAGRHPQLRSVPPVGSVLSDPLKPDWTETPSSRGDVAWQWRGRRVVVSGCRPRCWSMLLLILRAPSCPEIPYIPEILKLSWNFSHLARMSWYWPLLCRSYGNWTLLLSVLLAYFLP